MLNISELLNKYENAVIIGIAVVFLVLIIVLGAMKLSKAACKKTDKEEKRSSKITKQESHAFDSTKQPVAPDAEELIAVITAAIAASLNTSTYNLKIKSIKRVKNWRIAARREVIY